ncbi:hypothetical protein F4777DRAFT_390142 [Nemania sp. FL0916]|nr:hypothetical protein F4777DRAFT_390142 [Nemania sp. FL0916]
MVRISTFGSTDLWDPSHRFQTSWLVSPWVLFGIRTLLALYAFATIFTNIGYECTHVSAGGCVAAANGFSFFTVLSYWGVAFYFAVASFHTFFYARYGRTLLDAWPRPLQFLHALLYSTVTTYPLLVTIVFWALLALPSTLATTFSAWGNISEHALNSAFALFEVIVPRTAPGNQPWIHLPFLLLGLALYLALAYITHATKGFYTYTFLDPGLQGSLVAAYVFGIAVGICILFALVKGAVALRRWITEDKLGKDGVFAHEGKYGATSGGIENGRVGKDAEGRHALVDMPV